MAKARREGGSEAAVLFEQPLDLSQRDAEVACEAVSLGLSGSEGVLNTF